MRLPPSLGLPLLLAALVAGCGGGIPATAVVVAYAEAVQSGDVEALFCLSAGAAGAAEPGDDAAARRQAFARWFEAEREAYLQGRDAGRIELTGHGARLVQLFALGRGTYSAFGPPRRRGEDRREIEAELRFGYDQIDLSRYSPGTTLYLSGAPAGTVHAVRIPAGRQEVTVSALESVVVRWGLVRQPPADGCPGGWTVTSAEVVPDSERPVDLTLVF